MSSALFSAVDLRGVSLKNRVVVSPMHQYAAVDGHPTTWHLINSGKFAVGGAGLVMMEATKVERRGCVTVGDLGLWDDTFVADFVPIVEAIHAQGAKAGIQLGHCGRKGHMSRPWEGGRYLQSNPGVVDWDDWELVAPSAIPAAKSAPVPRALAISEIADLIERWGDAARRAHAAGFDVVEIHGGHGYLVHQFLSERANARTDAYGGAIEQRMRFAIEVAACVRAQWPDEKPLFVRLSCEDDGGWGIAESVHLARRLRAVGVDLIDCSSGGMAIAPGAEAARAVKYGYQVPYAEQIRAEAGIMTMAVGNIVHAEQAEKIVASGQADLVAIGREMLLNPNWPIDAAHKLGIDPEFANAPPAIGYWLGKRAKSRFEGVPSTWAGPRMQPAVDL